MERFSYESSGTETLMVYHLGEGEHLDVFAKNMLQSNEMRGILPPSFTQRDQEQYVKYPVSAKLPLTELQQKPMERETVLKILLSLVSAMQEVEEYMLDPGKLLLDPEYIMVDIREKKAKLLYLPIEELTESKSPKEFILYWLSHIQYDLNADCFYVVRLIQFLNQKTPWELEGLFHFIEGLMQDDAASASGEKARPQQAAGVRMDRMETGGQAQMQGMQMQGMQMQGMQMQGMQMQGVPKQGVPKQAIPMPTAPVQEKSRNPIRPELPKKPMSSPSATPQASKPKKGMFGGKKEKPAAELPHMAVPGVEPPKPTKAPVPEVVLQVDEAGNYLTEQGTEKKKKGLFGFGKKKEKPVTAQNNIPAPAMPKQANAGYQANRAQQAMPMQSMERTRPTAEGATVYMGHGNSDDENRTVVMGGGKDYGATVVLGSGTQEQASHIRPVVRVVRRRTGQSVTMHKETFRIGSEGSFVDFFIGDNPAVSSCHADIFEDNGAYYIMDRNSTNHTFVNHIQIQPMQAVQLSSGDLLTLADEDFEFIMS